jgi:8-oxo-dGTP pyrophosphatase MutT (NUDIX family)
VTRAALASLVILLLAACMRSVVPPCPYEGTPDFAPSAGCLAVIHGKILVVDSHKGGLSPPGGKALSGESAQCAAHRETFEETGLNLLPRQLVHVFDTGFHLYYCEIHAESGLIASDALEVKRGFWLPVEDFDKVQWRFPGQGEALAALFAAPAPESEGDPAGASPTTEDKQE